LVDGGDYTRDIFLIKQILQNFFGFKFVWSFLNRTILLRVGPGHGKLSPLQVVMDKNMPSEAQKLHASFPSANFLRRFAAWIYDFLVACAMVMLATALALGASAIATSLGWLTLPEGMDHAEFIDQGPWLTIFLLTVLAVFFGYFWKTSGQTVGMRAWRLKLQQRDGSRLTYKQVIIRLLTCMLGVGNIWVLVDLKHRRAWQDYAAKTELVTLSKEANQLFYWKEL
jgi:uncharacterized RDD family membrane protein YckC|tara:strand:- start:1635 stop:2312 length:678 start_codon:yes stop_codon:yes gene_type:complete